MRIVAVAGFVTTFSLLVSAIALVPTYVLFLEPVAATEGAAQKSPDEEQYVQIADTLKTSMGYVTQLSKPVESIETSKIVSHIEGALSPKVAVTSMHFSLDKGKAHIEARGTAQTRESLRQFLDALKKDTFFADAQIPISDLAKDTNLVFTLTLTQR